MEDKDENDPDYWINMAFTLSSHDKTDKAIKYYEKALELDPENIVALNNLGNAYSEQGDLETAKKHLQYLTRRYPDYVEGWINLGVLYGEEGNKLDQEMKCFKKALELDPSRPQIWRNIGNIYRTKKMFPEAKPYYEESLRLRPEHVDTLYDKAFVHFNLNETDEAEKCYDKILEIDPNHADANSDKGVVLCKKGKYVDGIPFFDRALRDANARTRIRTLRNKAIALQKLGKTDGARKCDEEANRLESGR